MNQTPEDTNSVLNMRKVALTALAGTSIEWYDFFLYGAAAALIFPTALFGEVNPSTALILSLLTFAAGFIARPIGGIIFGHFGDKIGRKKTLVIALILMGVASTLIGLLPTYAMIGVAAPIILTILRFAQGLAIGGQWGGAMLLVTESAPPNQRGFYGAYAHDVQSISCKSKIPPPRFSMFFVKAAVAFKSCGFKVSKQFLKVSFPPLNVK